MQSNAIQSKSIQRNLPRRSPELDLVARSRHSNHFVTNSVTSKRRSEAPLFARAPHCEPSRFMSRARARALFDTTSSLTFVERLEIVTKALDDADDEEKADANRWLARALEDAGECRRERGARANVIHANANACDEEDEKENEERSKHESNALWACASRAATKDGGMALARTAASASRIARAQRERVMKLSDAEAIASDDAHARIFVRLMGVDDARCRATVEECASSAKTALERGMFAFASKCLVGLARGRESAPSKLAPQGVDFAFVWRVCETWCAFERSEEKKDVARACARAMKAVVAHPTHARGISSALVAARATEALARGSEDDGKDCGAGGMAVPEYIREITRRVARAAVDADEVALRLAPWLARTMCEIEASERKASEFKDARAVFVGVFEPIAVVFLSAPKMNGVRHGKKRSTSATPTSAGDAALTSALVGLLQTAIDFKLYSSLDDGIVERTLRAFVSDMATAGAQEFVRPRGWSAVISTLSTLDFRLVEPHVKMMLTLLLVRSQDSHEECVDVIRSMTNAFAESREMPDFVDALGEALASTRETDDGGAHAALASERVLASLGAAAETVPIGQSPELLEACRRVFFQIYDDPSHAGVLDVLANVLQCVIAGCPDVPGEPLLPAAQSCLEGFTDDIAKRLEGFERADPIRVGSLLRVYTSIAALRQGLSEVADETAKAPYFRAPNVELSAVAKHLIRSKPNSRPENESAEAAAIGSSIQRIKTLSRLRYPRSEIEPDVAAKAGKEIKALLSACLRLVPETAASTSYDAPEATSKGWRVLISSYNMWSEHVPDLRLMDYFRCRLECADDGANALSTANEDEFSELIASFKPWSNSIASVLVRAAKDWAQAMSSKANPLCEILDDIIPDCTSGQGTAASIDALKRFWMAAASLPIENYVISHMDYRGKECLAMKRLKRALQSAEHIHERAVKHMDAAQFVIALEVCDCATFTALALGEPSALDLCARTRVCGAFLAKHDETAAEISCQVGIHFNYQLATIAAARGLGGGAVSAQLLGATTDEFHAALIGSTKLLKPAVFSRALVLVENLARDHLVPKTKSIAITPGCVFAALMTEAILNASLSMHLEPEREKFGWVEGNPNLPPEPELTDEQGEVVATFWDRATAMQVLLAEAIGNLSANPSSLNLEYIDVASACVSAIGYGLALSATTLQFGEKYHRTYDPSSVQIAMAFAIKVLLPQEGQGWVDVSEMGVVKIVNFLGAACEALKTTGPQFSPEAHASLVAVTLSTYTQGTRAAARKGLKNATPGEILHDALGLTLMELIYGAGKRPLNAMYAACVEAFKTTDAESRRAYLSSDRLDVSLSAPLWCLFTLIKSFPVSKAVRASTQENAEAVMDACMGVMNVAITVSNANAVVCNILEIATELARLGARCEISTRCVTRMCQLTSVAHTIDAVVDDEESSVLIFSQACELLGALLKARRDHLKRAVSSVTVTCSDMLNSLRRMKATGASDDVMEKCARKLSFVYEAAESSGLDRYCTHLLADAITAITGGGLGAVAEKSLKPGLFALLDSCSDRELQQLHAALGAGAGGARRVVFSALRDDHKQTHKFDGRI